MTRVPQPRSSRSLQDWLAEVLPADTHFGCYHISTAPTRCPPLFSAPPGGKPEKTQCESHFLAVTIYASSNTASQEVEEVLVLAIEILVYTTCDLTTVFVSKADSSGFLTLLGLPRSTISPLRTITTTFISWIVRTRQRTDVKLVVSLFARASDQYLFPGSVENPSKHISTDRELIKWWCRVLDPVLHTFDTATCDQILGRTTSQAYIIVPGEDSVMSFLPGDVRMNPELRKRWKGGHPLREITAVPMAPPRCLIPHFPDDPKARFVDELDDELQDVKDSRNSQSPSKRGNGQWKSVKSLDQFWEMMAFRQECSAGRLVGFIWIVFPPGDTSLPGRSDSQSTMATRSRSSSPISTLGKYPCIEPPMTGIVAAPAPSKQSQRKKLKGPIKSRVPRIKKTSSEICSAPQDAMSGPYYRLANSRAEVVLDGKEYKKAIELLLRLDFAGLDLAVKSSRTWIEEVGVLAGVDGVWGQRVVGKASGSKHQHDSNGVLPAIPSSRPTMLIAKKKRKAEEPPEDGKCNLQESTTTPEATNGVVNVLSASIVRKKAKMTSAAEIETEPVLNPDLRPPAPVINILGPGLVRKGPKAA